MGGEEGAGADDEGEVFGYGPGETQAVQGAGAAADFVEDDEAFFGGVVEDVGGFDHFDHEGGLSAVDFVAGADAGEETVGDADAGGFGGDVAADLGEDGDEGDLADEGGFSGHVGAGDEQDGVFAGEAGVVGDEFAVELLLEDGVAAFDDFEGAGGGDFGAAIAALGGEVGQGAQAIETGQALGEFGEGGDVGEKGDANLFEELLLEFDGALLGGEGFGFEGFEFFGDIALGVFDGLFAGPGGGDFLAMRVGDFDVVAEDFIEADFQGGDAGFGGEAGLEIRLAICGCWFRSGGGGLVRGRRRGR